MAKEDISNKIIDYYDNLSYYTRYIKDIWLSIIIIICIILFFIYLYIIIKIKSIRNVWPSQRCNPIYMPFAGMIHRIDDKSVLESTQTNFIHCANKISNDISDKVLSPYTYASSLITKIFTFILKALNAVREFTNILRDKLQIILKTLFGIILKVVSPLILFFKSLIRIIKKLIAILKSILLIIISIGVLCITVIFNIRRYVILIISLLTTTIYSLSYTLLFMPAPIPYVFVAPFLYAIILGMIPFLAIFVLVFVILNLFYKIIQSIINPTNKKNKPKTPYINKYKDQIKI
jgi:hypothetical protein